MPFNNPSPLLFIISWINHLVYLCVHTDKLMIDWGRHQWAEETARCSLTERITLCSCSLFREIYALKNCLFKHFWGTKPRGFLPFHRYRYICQDDICRFLVISFLHSVWNGELASLLSALLICWSELHNMANKASIQYCVV